MKQALSFLLLFFFCFYFTQTRIERISTRNKSDPKALEILNELLKRYKENSPQSLDVYSFKSYNKISVDFDRDSVMAYQDFIATRKGFLSQIQNGNFKRGKNRIKDSLKQESLINLVRYNQYFIWEKEVEYSFSKKYGEKINLLDNKMAGFSNPIYEALELNISILNKIPLPIKQKSRAIYHYYFLDTINLDNEVILTF